MPRKAASVPRHSSTGTTLGALYQLAVALGRAADPRGDERITEILALEQRRFDELPAKRKPFFDREALTNPYPDTRILFGERTQPVTTVLVGIDITSAEILLADRLRERGMPIDAVISHHPEGQALAQLDTQVLLQTDLLANYGVPLHIAEHLLEKRVSELGRSLSPINHNQAVDAARLLGLPFLSTHTATDNLVYQFMKRFVLDRTPKIVDDIIDALMELEEYQVATTYGAGPRIYVGHGKRRVGRIAFTEVTGGTSGAKEVYEHLSQHGIGTVVGMHMKEEYKKAAEEAFLSVVIAGHMSSDSLGMNLLMDHLEAAGVTVIPASGFIRVAREATQPERYDDTAATTTRTTKGAA